MFDCAYSVTQKIKINPFLIHQILKPNGLFLTCYLCKTGICYSEDAQKILLEIQEAGFVIENYPDLKADFTRNGFKIVKDSIVGKEIGLEWYAPLKFDNLISVTRSTPSRM
jgi:hypothetical protein